MVPSGTYPLAASAPLPSEAKKIAAAAAAAEAGGGEARPQKGGKESRTGRLEELNTLRVELDLKELEVGVLPRATDVRREFGFSNPRRYCTPNSLTRATYQVSNAEDPRA